MELVFLALFMFAFFYKLEVTSANFSNIFFYKSLKQMRQKLPVANLPQNKHTLLFKNTPL